MLLLNGFHDRYQRNCLRYKSLAAECKLILPTVRALDDEAANLSVCRIPCFHFYSAQTILNLLLAIVRWR